MRSTTLLLLAAAAAASTALDQQQSLPSLCRNDNPHVFVHEALMLDLWQEPAQHPANCSVRLVAPAGHYLAIAYHPPNNQTDQCPIRLDLAYDYYGSTVKVEDLCTRQLLVPSLLPSMFPATVTLEAHEAHWPPKGHRLHITAVGINAVCDDRKKYYLCATMNPPPNQKALSRFCVRYSLVCDGLLNCPASGADEIETLCVPRSGVADGDGGDGDGTSILRKQLRELVEQAQLEIFNSAQTAEEEFSWWWYLAATCLSLVLLVTGVAVAAYCRNTNQDESDSETTGMSTSCPESCPEREDPPPDYKSIFLCEEPV
ncbi:Hypothetical predicted protein [Cloeon dipterum]|uniref:CUB domain-containing protein n=1 Tax=Cloeon dipterum TaxID=197152 RepID=A0A8S1D178_9INSE|nr:Hypothetical predicted protein [Cloeon dipterum]